LINPNNESFQVLEDIRKGLRRTAFMREMGFEFWPLIGSTMFENGTNWRHDYATSARAQKNFRIGINLVNSDKKIISIATANINMTMDFIIRTNVGSTRGEVDLCNINCKPKVERITFSSVNANDITDTLTIQITSVNGVNVQDPANQGYISIRTGSVPRL
jgi:hypothetical protein